MLRWWGPTGRSSWVAPYKIKSQLLPTSYECSYSIVYYNMRLEMSVECLIVWHWNNESVLKFLPPGLFQTAHMSYEADRNQTREPSLAEMTEKAIKLLSRGTEGYFLFVGGKFQNFILTHLKCINTDRKINVKRHERIGKMRVRDEEIEKEERERKRGKGERRGRKLLMWCQCH